MIQRGVEEGDESHVFLTRLHPDDQSVVRLAVKDCIDVAGTITTAGCKAIAEVARPATRDAACLAGARATGVAIVGKTNLHELCFGATGINPHYGTPVNPLDSRRIPGGSSSGSAVAVATNVADVAFGTDTAGSVRNPAACCGVVGLKTTYGLIDTQGTRPLAPSMDTIGPLARDMNGVVTGMKLLQRGFEVLPLDRARDFRFGILRFAQTDGRLNAAIDAALWAAGIIAHDVELRDWETAHLDGLTIMYFEALETNRVLWEDHAATFGVDVRMRFERASRISQDEYDQAVERREQWRAELGRLFGFIDVLGTVGLCTFPSFVRSAPPDSNMAAVAVSHAGIPALCLPVPTFDGPLTTAKNLFPASLQLIGPTGAESFLCGVGQLVERAVSTAR